MTISIYNPYLLITTLKEIFRVIKIQIDNIIILANKKFLAFKENELQKAKLIIKLKKKLIPKKLLIFN